MRLPFPKKKGGKKNGDVMFHGKKLGGDDGPFAHGLLTQGVPGVPQQDPLVPPPYSQEKV